MSRLRQASTARATWLTAALIVHILILGMLAVHLLTREAAVVVESTQQAPTNAAGRPFAYVDGSKPIRQSFTFAKPNLARIDILLEPARKREHYEIRMALRDTPQGPDLRIATLDAADVRAHQYYPFVFDVVANAEGRRYFVVLTSRRVRATGAVAAWGVTCDCFFGGELLDQVAPNQPPPGNGAPDPAAVRDMVMATYFIPPGGRLGKLRELSNRLDFYKPRWLGSAALQAYAAGALVTYGASLWLAVWSLIRRLPSRRDAAVAIVLIVVSSLLGAGFVVGFT